MIKYAEIINNKTGLCSIGSGTNSEFYKSIGMTELDVTQSYIDGQWYLTENLNTDEYKINLSNLKKEQERDKIKQQLNDIDLKSIRALRCNESERLQSLEIEAENLRVQLNNL